jgi:hypothetical protein
VWLLQNSLEVLPAGSPVSKTYGDCANSLKSHRGEARPAQMAPEVKRFFRWGRGSMSSRTQSTYALNWGRGCRTWNWKGLGEHENRVHSGDDVRSFEGVAGTSPRGPLVKVAMALLWS